MVLFAQQPRIERPNQDAVPVCSGDAGAAGGGFEHGADGAVGGAPAGEEGDGGPVAVEAVVVVKVFELAAVLGGGVVAGGEEVEVRAGGEEGGADVQDGEAEVVGVAGGAGADVFGVGRVVVAVEGHADAEGVVADVFGLGGGEGEGDVVGAGVVDRVAAGLVVAAGAGEVVV